MTEKNHTSSTEGRSTKESHTEKAKPNRDIERTTQEVGAITAENTRMRKKAELLLQRLANDKEKERLAARLEMSKKIGSVLNRKLTRMLAAVAVVGFTGLGAMRFLDGAQAEHSESAEPGETLKRDMSERLTHLKRNLEYALTTANQPNEAQNGAEGGDPSDIKWMTQEEIEEFNREREEAEAERRKEEERAKAKEEQRMKLLDEHFAQRTVDITKEVIEMMRGVKSGHDIRDWYWKQHEEDLFNFPKVDKDLKEYAKQLEDADPGTAKKIYEFLGTEPLFDFALKHDDADALYDNVIERLTQSFESERSNRIFYADDVFSNESRSEDREHMLRILQTLPDDEKAAIIKLMEDNADAVDSTMERIEREHIVGEIDEDALKNGSETLKDFIKKLK